MYRPDAHDDTGEGPLLFDPNASEADTEAGPDRGGNGGRSVGMPIVFGAAAVLSAALTWFVFGSRGEPTQPSPVPEVPAQTETRAGPEPGSTLQPAPDSILSGSVGDSIEFSLVHRTLAGQPLADALVRFGVESGTARLLSDSAKADESGVVSGAAVLPTEVGTTVVVATLPGAPLVYTRLQLIALAGPPQTIQMVSGNGQAAPIGDVLPARVAVRVADAHGNPVPNAEVRFRIDEGDGIRAPSVTRTDSLGAASALWRMGIMEGRQRLTALAAGIPTVVGFTATALATTVEEEEGPLETSAVVVSAKRFAIGGSHVCQIDGGSLRCRGGNDRGQSAVGSRTGVAAVVTGAAHVCTLEADGTAICWGANERGQLGDGSRTDKAQPTSVRTELRFSMLSAGAAHTCGLAGGGVPFCWGHNLNGQLGDGSRNDQTSPRTVGSGLQFQSIASGWNHTCGLSSNGNLFCWGLNNEGQLGDGGRLDRLEPTLVRGAVDNLVAGSVHSCGITEGEVLCWGGNAFGQLGTGSLEDRTQPTSVTGLPGRPTALAAGAVHTCALTTGGQAFCWGQNFQGQLGDGTTESRMTPTPVAGNLTFVDLYAGGAQTCGITAGGEEYCWGMNQSGQLGDGTRMSRSTPTLVPN